MASLFQVIIAIILIREACEVRSLLHNFINATASINRGLNYFHVGKSWVEVCVIICACHFWYEWRL